MPNIYPKQKTLAYPICSKKSGNTIDDLICFDIKIINKRGLPGCHVGIIYRDIENRLIAIFTSEQSYFVFWFKDESIASKFYTYTTYDDYDRHFDDARKIYPTLKIKT